MFKDNLCQRKNLRCLPCTRANSRNLIGEIRLIPDGQSNNRVIYSGLQVCISYGLLSKESFWHHEHGCENAFVF